jgi:hypothetical protein
MHPTMSEPKPWFRVMTPAEANRPGSQWVRRGAASRGKLVAMPIAWEGWLAILVFIVVLATTMLVIWLWAFPARLPLMLAILATLAVGAIVVGGFVHVVRTRALRS